MNSFYYQATDTSGRLVKGSMEAKDERGLVDRLQEMGYLPIEIRPDGDGAGTLKSGFTFKSFSKKVPGKAVVSFTQELHSMLEAGLAIDSSLAILSEIEGNPRLREIIKDLYRSIQGGKTLAGSMEDYPEVFSDIYISMVRAGEAGGALEATLGRLKDFMEETQKLKEEVRSALVYPILLTLVGGMAVAVMVFFVLPKFASIFEDMGGALPLPTVILLSASKVLTGYWWVIVGSALAGELAIRRYIRTVEGRLFLDGLKLKVPLFGTIYLKITVSRFSRTLGVLLQSGLPIIEALKMACVTMGNNVMLKRITPVIEGVRRGRGMAAPLKEISIFPALAVHMLTIGEETGRLDEMLLKLADKYDFEVGISIKKIVSLMEPALIMVMAVIVGFIVISLLGAIFSLNDMSV